MALPVAKVGNKDVQMKCQHKNKCQLQLGTKNCRSGKLHVSIHPKFDHTNSPILEVAKLTEAQLTPPPNWISNVKDPPFAWISSNFLDAVNFLNLHTHLQAQKVLPS